MHDLRFFYKFFWRMEQRDMGIIRKYAVKKETKRDRFTIKTDTNSKTY